MGDRYGISCCLFLGYDGNCCHIRCECGAISHRCSVPRRGWYFAGLGGTTGTGSTLGATVARLAIGAACLAVGGLLQALVALPALARSLLELRARWCMVVICAVAVFVYPLAFYSSMHFAGVAIGTVSS